MSFSAWVIWSQGGMRGRKERVRGWLAVGLVGFFG